MLEARWQPRLDQRWRADGRFASTRQESTGAGGGWGCAIITSIGGKAKRLIGVVAVKRDGILVVKHFSGGGTVVVDRSWQWTTFIGQKAALPHVKPFLRPMMEWNTRDLCGPALTGWDQEVVRADTTVEGSFQLRENDYMIGAHKMGDNAQAILSGEFLHHTGGTETP